MANNRKRTRGRKIQVVRVPEFKGINPMTGVWIRNPHPNAGKIVQIKHR